MELHQATIKLRDVETPVCWNLFCRLIDGMDTLDDLEKQPVTEKGYRPITDICIRDITIHANPLADWWWLLIQTLKKRQLFYKSILKVTITVAGDFIGKLIITIADRCEITLQSVSVNFSIYGPCSVHGRVGTQRRIGDYDAFPVDGIS